MDWDIGDIFDIFGRRVWRIGSEVGEAGMVGGGVEARIRGDEFTGMLHANDHFATGFVVVAGGGKNVFDGTRVGTFV